jgi:hypothetical protein
VLGQPRQALRHRYRLDGDLVAPHEEDPAPEAEPGRQRGQFEPPALTRADSPEIVPCGEPLSRLRAQVEDARPGVWRPVLEHEHVVAHDR